MKKISITFILVLLTSLSFVTADLRDNDQICGMGSMMYGSYGTIPLIFGWTFSILVLIGLILFIIWIIKQIQKK